MRSNATLEKLKKSVEEMEASLAEEAAHEAIAVGIDPVIAINDGLAKGMKTVSDLFDEGEAFIPQLLVAADAFETGAGVLNESLEQNGRHRMTLGRVLICTVRGDIHDIGKNIVKMMLVTSGFEVIDLGRDVPTAEIVSKAKECDVDIIVCAALMRTTMPAQKEIIQALEEEGIRDKFKCMFGGAPVSEAWVKEIRGDAYAETASQAVEKAKGLMESLRAMGSVKPAVLLTICH